MTAAGVHLSLLLLSCSALPDIWKLLKCFCSEFFWWTLSGSFRADLNAWCEDGGRQHGHQTPRCSTGGLGCCKGKQRQELCGEAILE